MVDISPVHHGQAIRLFDAAQPAAATELLSPVILPQMVREEQVTFWILVTGTFISGSVQIRVSPEPAADPLTTPQGMLLHAVVWTGTANSAQTKVNGQGHALVVVQAMPRMWLRIQGTAGTEIVDAWAVI